MPTRTALLLWFSLVASGLSAGDAPAPTPPPPAERLSETRARIVLNGWWQFQPAARSAATAPDPGAWGLMPVPGAWLQQGWSHGRGFLPSLVKKGDGAGWSLPLSTVGRAWYQRDLTIPADWQGRAIVLSFQRVATDATVSVDGQPVGTVQWPSGEVDLTHHVTPGRAHRVTVLVVATPDAGESIVWMGTTPGQNPVVKATLPAAGLIGEVMLTSRPRGPGISDGFVLPSVRRGELALEVELSGCGGFPALAITTTVHRWDPVTRQAAPEPEKVFQGGTFAVPKNTAGAVRRRLVFPWADARRWDLEQPHLYVAKIRIVRDGSTVIDEYPVRFGFREFWVEGRELILNGTPFRLRPFVSEYGREPVTRETIDGFIAGLKQAGFNCSQQWPNDQNVRGSLSAQRAWFAERADELGWPVLGCALSLNGWVFDGQYRSRWDEPGRKERWRAQLVREIRPLRNHPSILAWGTSANLFNHAQDQNPRSIGRRGFAPDLGQRPQDAAGREAFGWLKALDPTRPFFTHAGNSTGDIYTANTYLNHIPLQEREEWLSAWARDGEMPYLAVEFGNPLFTDFLRGRDAFGRATTTEPLATEYAASWLGPDAYATEAPAYRTAIRTLHQSDLTWANWHPNLKVLAADPNVQAYQADLIRGTWRAWRTAGISGGMVPWNLLDNALFTFEPPAVPAAAAPVAGHRFAWEPNPWPAGLTFLDAAQGWHALPGGEALLEVNGPTLAWIAGRGDRLDFYEKRHHYRGGEAIGKQVAVLNDLRQPADFAVTVRAWADGKEVFTHAESGSLAAGQTRLLPFQFVAPSVGATTELRLELVGKIAGREHTDRFILQVYPARVAPASGALWVFDPVGRTTAMLTALGYQPQPLEHLRSFPAPGTGLVIVGRDALVGGVPTAALLDHIRAGGHVLVSTQQPEWLRKHLGLRVSRFLSRRVWPAQRDHPVLKGLPSDALRDWAGESTLVDPRPVTTGAVPPFGWRWGGRGAVSSAAVEIPHRAGWRPLLRAEFDLAYSPLLERDLGRGRLWLSTLDLEDHASIDPAAAQLLDQLLAYAATAPAITPATHVVYLGDEAGWSLTHALGLNRIRATSLPSNAQTTLAIVGEQAPVTTEQLEVFARAGGRVLLLRRTAETAPADAFFGAPVLRQVSQRPDETWQSPDPLLAGLGAADLRTRTDTALLVLGHSDGMERHAGGLIGIRRIGPGVVVHAQLAPDRLDASREPWLRLTRWRHTRALAQLAANLGAAFLTDGLPAAGTEPLYHPDYRTDFPQGDEPARYYRW